MIYRLFVGILICLGTHVEGQSLNRISEELLYAVRIDNRDRVDQQLRLLNDLTVQQITDSLNTDVKKYAFWLNIYNAFIQIQLSEKPELYENRSRFFSRRSIPIAGEEISFNFIENGILRRSKVLWGLGYVQKLFPRKLEKQWRVNHEDYRIHFGLNCGATSCPPIPYFTVRNLENELRSAEESFIRENTSVEGKIITTSSIFSWFRGDFGGKKGVIQLVRKYNLVDSVDGYKVKFAAYDWSLYLKAYSTN
jgi:hypothetical protein